MKILLSMLCVFVSFSSLAADYDIEVCKVQAVSYRNDVYIQPCNKWISKNNCPNDDWITWDASAFQGQAMYSTAMAAMLANKKITVRFDGSSCNTFDITTMVRMNN